jgi:gliding motility-associated-like protein
MYTLSAQTAWGCVAKDTTEVKAKQSALIDLGRDTSICEGTGWLLDAGSAYKSYLWNDGATTRYKSIDQKGMYFVSATDSNGCVSKDTLQVVSVFPTSEVNIHQKQVVCKGQSDVLSPGNGYLSYLWQDGSTSSNFAVSSEGKYWVKVTDKNYCMGSDSVTITALVSLSSNFIYSDTSLCPSETLVLRPYVSYKRYQWNDGSSLPYLNISSPGMYSLQVEDGNGCLAKKQISVAQKQCPNVIYFPTAFTPNKDGKNDVFKPFVEGYLLKYQLIIYNRWGQKIFYATGPDKGWDGFFNGRLQDNGVFVWQCWYQFSGTEAKVQKGSIVLIK